MNRAVRNLNPEDAPALLELRRAAIDSEPSAFGASPGDDLGQDRSLMETALADPQQAVFGSFAGDRLTGMVGIVRQKSLKRRHKAEVWGMYVSPDFRGKGVGRAMLGEAIRHARSWPGVTHIHLSVTETSTAAKILYESLGFRVWGREPAAHGWQGLFLDEYHLVLDLSNDPASPMS